CLFWFDSKFQYLINPTSPRPPAIQDDFRLIESSSGPVPFDDHDPQNVVPVVNSLAMNMMTSPLGGTIMESMYSYLVSKIDSLGLEDTLEVSFVPHPDWEFIRDEVTRSQDVILLLGFWQEYPSTPMCPLPDWQSWSRVGGHYITVAGVDTVEQLMAISDPYYNLFEAAVHPPEDHNDLALNSGPHYSIIHDWYLIADGSPSPGGVLWIPDYPVTYDDNGIINFEGTNPPVFDWVFCMTNWQYLPIHVEIEYAITICPTFECDCVPGDANDDTNINLLDILYLIDHLYGTPLGPAPIPYDTCSGDPNCDCAVNLLDILLIIDNLYGTGLPLCDCDAWVAACGLPLRE
ncbi:MAG: hypothetical protein JSV44_04740, partial [Candidatus Zixiibacteriota bacterium]